MSDSTNAAWPEWKFRCLAWIGAIDPQVRLRLDEAEGQSDEIIGMDPSVQTGGASSRLWLDWCTALQLLKSVPLNNGCEAWRTLCREFDPRVATRQLQALDSLLEPQLSPESQCLVKFMKWERDMQEWERMAMTWPRRVADKGKSKGKGSDGRDRFGKGKSKGKEKGKKNTKSGKLHAVGGEQFRRQWHTRE